MQISQEHLSKTGWSQVLYITLSSQVKYTFDKAVNDFCKSNYENSTGNKNF